MRLAVFPLETQKHLLTAVFVMPLWPKSGLGTTESLTSDMREALVQSCFQASSTSTLKLCWQDFRNVYARLKSLDPYFVPQSPQALQIHIKSLFGYPAAERVAVAYRGAKRRLLRQHLH